MMNGISKAIALYLAPVLALTATLLSLFAFLAPTLLLSDRVALLTVSPSTELTQPANANGGGSSVDGPSLFLGPIGSCARSSNEAPVNCTFPSVSPQYGDASTPVFISIALALDIGFLITFTLISLRHKMGKAGGALGTPLLQNLSAGIGFMGFMIGLTSFLILRMWFGKTVQDFNSSIQAQGSQGPKLVASTGNAFTNMRIFAAYNWTLAYLRRTRQLLDILVHHVKHNSNQQDKATTDRNARTLRELVKRPENKVCADCKRNDPRWASWNLGVFLCIRCSGIHRGMGTHISKVKSVDLDMWTPEQMESIQKWGNRRANLYWEAHLKQGHIPPEHKMESFIRSKYESRRWAKEGPPPPDPSVLENGLEAPPPPQEQPASTRQTHTSRTSVSSPRASGFTTQQPQAHQLLSSNFTNQTRTQAQTQPAAQPTQAALAAPAAQDDLFSLDFHAPPPVAPSNVAPEQPKRDVKQDIMSLFSTPPANAAPAVSPMNQFNSGLWGAPSQAQQPVQPTSMIGNNGIGAWGASSGWTQAPPAIPAQPNVWGAPTATNTTAQQATNSLFDTSNVWGGSSTTANTGFTPTTTTQKKDDVFGDIWGSFK
ncbi:hypothetical protein NP233_g7503 [Leucocoprinus birnbaumii]|uniref:Arf-GAP domain-containing protein n=1 Tax=Leucocoprinus birnbaumii TaxID=56174 RepID=A0AAD5VQV6_9AGAR|nr:hypothetical protein NP233_g7503 [Leucocoprinus birnbaumii]